jgi:tetratricopeptide (TPR) repeat protein
VVLHSGIPNSIMTNIRKHLFQKQRWLLSLLLFSLTFEFMACGAADIQSAKAYRQRRDYVRADEMLQKALKEDPTNDEAWYLYVVNLYDLKQYEKISTVIDSAMLYSTAHRGELQDIKHNTWIELYNGGLGAYNANPESKEAQQAAIGYLESARQLAPDQPETYDLLASIYYAAGDTAKAVDTYSQELNSVSASHQQGLAMGLMLRMKPADVERTIGGAPARIQTVPISGSDSSMIYIYPSKQAYIYFERAPKAPRDWQLTGWRITPVEFQGLQPLRVSEDAYMLVANNYYQQGLKDMAAGNKDAAATQFDKAIPLLMTLQQIDPSNDFAANAIPDIYTRLGRTEKAKQEYEKMLSEHPSKQTYVAYGLLQMKSQDYDGAIASFQKALDLDPNYEAALYDIAAAYKNSARIDQDSKDPKKIPGMKVKMQKSTEFFERLHAINRTDYTALSNLAENYLFLSQKDKAVGLISEMEAMKNSDAAKDPIFWETLGRLYARADRAKDSEAAFKQADTLKNH